MTAGNPLQNMARNIRKEQLFLLGTILLIVATLVSTAHAQIMHHVDLNRADETIELDGAGNAKVTFELNLPADVYTSIKSDNPSTTVMLRRLRFEPQWYEVEEVSGKFDDAHNRISISYRVPGMARIRSGEHWQFSLPALAGLDHIATTGDSAVFTSIVETDYLGQVNLVYRVKLPEAATGIGVSRDVDYVSYKLPEAPTHVFATGGGHPDFDLDVAEHVMSCLAKAYADSRFSHLWTARMRFVNTTGRSIDDYRVRFRIPGYSLDWSPWARTHRVVAGQTVVDAYFPHFDMGELAQLAGHRAASLEAEFEYRTAEGDLITDHVVEQLDVLGRNEVIYSSLPADDAVTWHDSFNNTPYILTAFVTHEDPIIQQVAGWVAAHAGGVAASDSDESAIAFMRALYEFMQANGISYQTPPAGHVDDQLTQHVKYGRDVLRNRAGTCIDLTIFYASVCQAVGLSPELYLIPGHCFPAVYLPDSGNLTAVETTMVGSSTFDEAREYGNEEMVDAWRNKPYFDVDTMALQEDGVYSLELPELPPSALSDWGIHPLEATPAQQAALTGGSVMIARTVGATGDAITGSWLFEGVADGEQVQYAVTLAADGTYACIVRGTEASGKQYEVTQTGRYQVGPGVIVFQRDGDFSIARAFTIAGDTLELTMQEVGEVMAFRRVG